MILTLIEAALRSLLLAVAVWAGLRAFRVRNVLAQKSGLGIGSRIGAAHADFGASSGALAAFCPQAPP